MLPLSAKDRIDVPSPEFDLAPIEQSLAAAEDARAEIDPAADDAEEQHAAIDALIASLEESAHRVRARRDEIGADKVPVYTLAVPTLFQRQAYRRDMAAEIGSMPSNHEWFEALRDAVRDVAPENEAELIGTLDDFETRSGGDDPAGMPPSLARDVKTIEAQLMGVPIVRAVAAQRGYWLTMAPLVAFRHFVIGWRNVRDPDGNAVKFARAGATLSEATLDLIPEADLVAVGWRALALLRPGGEQEKNSPSPSRSPKSRKTSPAANPRPTAAKGGKSAAGSIAETRAIG